jgi:hypothetical protein
VTYSAKTSCQSVTVDNQKRGNISIGTMIILLTRATTTAFVSPGRVVSQLADMRERPRRGNGLWPDFPPITPPLVSEPPTSTPTAALFRTGLGLDARLMAEGDKWKLSARMVWLDALAVGGPGDPCCPVCAR